MGMYTGFFSDLSTGVMFGLKFPSGVYTAAGLDRDTQIGTGSTDLILGAFHRGLINRRAARNLNRHHALLDGTQNARRRAAVRPEHDRCDQGLGPEYRARGSGATSGHALQCIMRRIGRPVPGR
jgi:hypothetical protein